MESQVRIRAPWAVFAALALGQLLVEVDDAVLNIALPSIARDLHLGPGTLPWIVNAYVLCFGGLLLLGGRLADRLGHRQIMLTGVALFTAGSLAGALAGSGPTLIAARVAQGVAAALIAPAAMGLLVHTFTGAHARNQALGLWGAVTGGSALVGLVVGGLVTEAFGWRWLFLGNALIAVIAGALLLRLAPSHTGDRRVTVEPSGALAVTAALVVLVHALATISTHGWASTHSLAELVGAVALGIVALVVERRSAHPLVPRSLWRNRVVVWADAVGFLAGAALLATFFFVSLHLQQTLHWSPLKAALGYIPLMGSLFAGAGVASALLSRIGQRRLIRAGMVAAATGLLILSRGVRVAPDPYVTALLPGFVVMGTGLGLILVALTTAAIPGGDERSDGGVASGLYNTALQIGGAVGIAVLATVARARTSALTRSGVGPTVALTRGRSTALVVAAVILAAGMVLAFGLPARVPDE